VLASSSRVVHYEHVLKSINSSLCRREACYSRGARRKRTRKGERANLYSGHVTAHVTRSVTQGCSSPDFLESTPVHDSFPVFPESTPFTLNQNRVRNNNKKKLPLSSTGTFWSTNPPFSITNSLFVYTRKSK